MKHDHIAIASILATILVTISILMWDCWNLIFLGREQEAAMDVFIMVLLAIIFSGLLTFLRKK